MSVSDLRQRQQMAMKLMQEQDKLLQEMEIDQQKQSEIANRIAEKTARINQINSQLSGLFTGQQIPQGMNGTSTQIPKKRGRKPKSYYENMAKPVETDNNDSEESMSLNMDFLKEVLKDGGLPTEEVHRRAIEMKVNSDGDLAMEVMDLLAEAVEQGLIKKEENRTYTLTDKAFE